MTLAGILEPVDTDYSGRGLRGWLRALSWATVHISALLWNGCQLRLLGCDNGASIPLSVLCGNVSISLWQEKSSLQFSPSFMSILFLLACRFLLLPPSLPPCVLLVFCLLPSSTAGMLGQDKEKAPPLSRFECFLLFKINDLFLGIVNTRDELS